MTVQPTSNSNGFAVAAAWLGIAAVAAACFPLLAFGGDITVLRLLVAAAFAAIPGILAVIFGVMGVGQANRNAGYRRTAAVWGIVLGVGAVAFAVVLRLLRSFLFGY